MDFKAELLQCVLYTCNTLLICLIVKDDPAYCWCEYFVWTKNAIPCQDFQRKEA